MKYCSCGYEPSQTVNIVPTYGLNKEEILKEWQDITKNIGASWLAEEERDRIRKRQREGIDAAKQRGSKLRRPGAEITPAFVAAYGE